MVESRADRTNRYPRYSGLGIGEALLRPTRRPTRRPIRQPLHESLHETKCHDQPACHAWPRRRLHRPVRGPGQAPLADVRELRGLCIEFSDRRRIPGFRGQIRPRTPESSRTEARKAERWKTESDRAESQSSDLRTGRRRHARVESSVRKRVQTRDRTRDRTRDQSSVQHSIPRGICEHRATRLAATEVARSVRAAGGRRGGRSVPARSCDGWCRGQRGLCQGRSS